MHFRCQSRLATAPCDQWCTGVRQRSVLSTGWLGRGRRLARLNGATSRAWPLAVRPQHSVWGAPLGRRFHPLPEGARRFVASGFRRKPYPTKVMVIDDIPLSSPPATRACHALRDASTETEPNHEDPVAHPCEPVGPAARTQHRGAIPRAGGGRTRSAGSPARSRTVTPLTGRPTRRLAGGPASGQLHRAEEMAERAADLQRPLEAPQG
jgi:hypothetical protein